MPRAARALCSAARRHTAARVTFGLALLGPLAACGRMTAAESGLNSDLALADQLHQRNAPALTAVPDESPAAPPAAARTPAPVRRAPVAHVLRVAAAPAAVASPRAGAAPLHRPATRTDASQAAAAGEVVGAVRDRDDRADAGTYTGPTTSTVASTDLPASEAPSGDVAATSAPTAQRQPQGHATRDGVFGSVAGAIIGAATSRGDRVRGGIIGAVTGGALGAIYGGTADRSYPGYGYGTTPGYRPTPTYRATTRYRGVRAPSTY